MVELVVNNFPQVSMLEWDLTMAGIEHTVKSDDGRYGFEPPYLIVDGVPLDYERSVKWLEGQINE